MRDAAPNHAPAAPRAALHTLGCRLNQSETATLAALLAARGFRIVPFETTADLVVINSCSVTADGDAATRQAVRAVLRRTPEAFVAVTGCSADSAGEALARLPGVDLVVASADKLRIPELVLPSLTKRAPAAWICSRPTRGDFTMPAVGLHAGHTRATLKIQDGCGVGCSFCIVPRTRGGARSRVFEDVLAEAQALVERGHLEIVLTGVNLGAYSQGGRDLAALLGALVAVPGLARLRISSIEPTTLTDAVLDVLASSPQACPFLHVPVQSGDDAVLERMRRPYRRADIERLLERIRRRLPEAAVGTDVMAGFPGEDEAAFARTLDLLESGGFAALHAFRYSSRSGTPAARLAAVPARAARARVRALRDLDAQLRRAYGERFVGRTLPVLFERRRRPAEPWTGLAPNGLRIAVQERATLAGTIRPVVVERAWGTGWRGRLAAPAAW